MQGWTGWGKGACAAGFAAAVSGLGGAGVAAQVADLAANEVNPYVWGDPATWPANANLADKDRPDLCDPARTQIHLTVTGIEEATGNVTAELYANNQKGFLNKKGRLRRVRAPASVGAVTFCLDVEPGVYAAVAYHDEDGDRDLDQKWNLMPKEPFGLSNDPKLSFGFPDITESLFAIEEPGGMVAITLVDP